MFPSDENSARPRSRSLRALLRDTLDTAVALATLESYTLDDVLGRHEPTAIPASAALADHPHRTTTARRPTHARRPGSVPRTPQPCLTPLTRERHQPAPRRTDRPLTSQQR